MNVLKSDVFVHLLSQSTKKFIFHLYCYSELFILAKSLFSEFKDAVFSDVYFQRLCQGTTNEVWRMKLKNSSCDFVVHIYGDGTSSMIDRKTDVNVF